MSRTQIVNAVNDGSGGTQTATFNAKSYPRQIERCNITGGPSGSTCGLYVGSISPLGFRDGSKAGDGDTAEYPNPLYVPAGERVFLQWSSATSQATAVIQWSGEG